MTSTVIDLVVVERRLRETLDGRYPNKDVFIEVGIAGNRGVRVAISATKGGVFYNQWVYTSADGVVTFPEPDDGMTEIWAKPRWVRHTATDDEAIAKALELVDDAVTGVQDIIDRKYAALLVDQSEPDVPAVRLRNALTAWNAPNRRGPLRLAAAAWVLLDRSYFSRAEYLFARDEDVRRDSSLLADAAALLHAVNAAPAKTAGQWCVDFGLPPTEYARYSVAPNPAEDELIEGAVRRGSLHLPLFGISVDAASHEDPHPRWIFEIVGEFRAIPSVAEDPVGYSTLIGAGTFGVLSTVDERTTTRVRLSYQQRLGERAGSHPVLLELIGRIPGAWTAHLERKQRASSLVEELNLRLTAERSFDATFESSNPAEIATMYQPKGWFDAENLYYDTWEFPEYEGRTTLNLSADADLIVHHVERLSDPIWLAARTILMDSLFQCWQTTGEPWESNGSFELPGGAYFQWTRTDEPGSDVHIEFSEGGDYATPIAAELVDLLVRMGWNPPDEDFRNCWTRAGRTQARFHRAPVQWFFLAANRIILATTLAAGVPLTVLMALLLGTPVKWMLDHLVVKPLCEVCGGQVSYVEVVPPGALPAEWDNWDNSFRATCTKYRDLKTWRFIFKGLEASNGLGDDITAERAAELTEAFREPLEFDRIHAAGFYDDVGFCSTCRVPYCRTHWSVGNGAGRCPQGHFRSFDPHWHPED